MTTIVHSNNSEFLGQHFLYNQRKNRIEIGTIFTTKLSLDDVTRTKITSSQETIKGALGTVGVAAVGGLLFGGAGAVVGGLAGGNKKRASTTQVAFEFNNGTWIVVEYGTGWMDSIFLKEIIAKYSSSVDSPFAV